MKIALVAAALSPLLVAVGKTIETVGKLMQFILNLPVIISGAKVTFSAFSDIAGPVLAVVAVIAVLVVAFKYLLDTNEEFRNNITAI